MRMTHHNGRTRADGSAFSAKHNDRNGFTADHINPNPEHNNFYRIINPTTQKPQKLGEDGKPKKSFDEHERDCYEELFGESLADQKEREALAAVHAEKEAVKEEIRKLKEEREEVRAEVETLTQEKTRLQRLVSRLSQSLGRLFDKLQSITMGRGTVLDYVHPEAQAVVDDLNELDNEEYEL